VTVPALLSVALPVRNGADYLAAALDSILAQTRGDFVLHVSDNASDDATPDILADYARRDARVRVSRSAQLIPQQANMNRAVGLTDTPWVKLFCHDDLMRADCLAQIAEAIRSVEGSDVALIGNGERHLYGNGHLTGPGAADTPLLVLPGHEAIARTLWDVRRAVPFPAVTTATVRRDAFAAIGGFDLRYVYFDLLAWLELLTRYDYAVLPEPLTINRIHGAQVAVRARASAREFNDIRALLPEFVAAHRTELGMTARQAWRVRMIPAAFAARALAVQLHCGRYRAALASLGRLPLHYWPVLLPLAGRAWLQERARSRDLERFVPRDLLYPGQRLSDPR
jgi:glycosyltransferase involved in cell wall biosynthesis